MNKDRLMHIYAVASKMVEIGRELELDDNCLNDLFILGFNHDIGYGLSDDFFNHGIIGGEILRDNGYKYWKEIYYHGKLQEEYQSLYLKILNMADMQIDKFGCDVGYDSRLEDIRSRYGIDSIQYQNSYKLVESLKND